jgi:hypothetical protein
VRIRRLLTATVTSLAALSVPLAGAATPPPAPGAWKIVAEHDQPGPPSKELTGSFKVSGNAIKELQGTTQHDLNSGCDPGVRIALVGSVPIRHALDTSIGTDYYYVGVAGPTSFAKVHVTVRGRGTAKHPATSHRVPADLRIVFPGGSSTVGGFTTYSNITYESKTAGTCNLKFQVTQ